MIDFIQIVLFAVIVILTFLLITLGIQVYFILKEVRRTLEKTNKVLENTETITESVSKPISSLASVAMTFNKTGSILAIAKIIKMILHPDDKPDSKNHKS